MKEEHILLYGVSTCLCVCATAGGHSGYSHSVPARIAVNMIMCCASGGSLAVVIACWAQVGRSEVGVGKRGGSVTVTTLT